MHMIVKFGVAALAIAVALACTAEVYDIHIRRSSITVAPSASEQAGPSNAGTETRSE